MEVCLDNFAWWFVARLHQHREGLRISCLGRLFGPPLRTTLEIKCPLESRHRFEFSEQASQWIVVDYFTAPDE